MNTTRICTRCHTPLPADAPAGLCPACLLKSEVPTFASPDAGGTPTDASRRSPVTEVEFGGYRILRRKEPRSGTARRVRATRPQDTPLKCTR